MRISRYFHLLYAELTGEAAYRRYLSHHAARHAEEPVLSKKAYFRAEEERKWKQVRRCC